MINGDPSATSTSKPGLNSECAFCAPPFEDRKTCRDPETFAELKRWEQLELAYWTKYAESKARILETALDEELVDSRMRSFRKAHLESNHVWRRGVGLM